MTEQTSLQDTWIQFRKNNPRVRIRDAARQLQTTEAEIIASFAGSSVLQLNNDFAGLLKRLPALGYVMVLTRNEYCVHERKGKFEQVAAGSGKPVGLVTGPDIDLRLFFEHWAFGFAVLHNEEAGFKNSIQVFDRQGTAVIKVFLQEQSNAAAFEQLVRDFSATSQTTALTLLPAPAPAVYRDKEVDVPAFQKDWSELKDTHDFFPMLKKHQVSRLHAIHIAGQFTKRLHNNTVVQLLERAAAENWAIMVFVGNHGCIQIHTGGVQNIVAIPGWINVLDPQFNLHLKLEGIAETWLVQKPTDDGPVHSIELYDAAGELIVQFFGKRKPGVPEDSTWRAAVTAL